ncbi:methyltransferase family protein [Nitzschia inconspicua]|uniref:Methyltransferase family protein n=1 Tax=Nitzschia inconspicua TaxID=303405 RepID=A0A9K3Q0U6_9STRA|nr:methyltransferase family protein [Nitzschia inconspicua]
MSEWRIYPPPGDSHERLQKHSKRQPVNYTYKVGDQVFFLVSKKYNEIAFRKIDSQLSTNGTNQKGIMTGVVTKLIQLDHQVQGSDDVDKKHPNSKKIHVVVAVDSPVQPSGSTQSNTATVTLDEKDQQRFLQPDMTATTNNKTVVVMIQETTPFRQAVQFQLSQDGRSSKDRVLEIGCSTGELSKRIWNAGVEAWIGMDNSAEMIQKCSQQLEQHNISMKQRTNINAKFTALRIDPLLEPHRAYEETTQALGGPPTVICLDIGGNRDLLPVIELMSWVFQFFVVPDPSKDLAFADTTPRLVLIKSRALVRDILHEAAGNNSRNEYTTGLVRDGNEWFDTILKKLRQEETFHHDNQRIRPRQFKHPAKAPLAYSPIDGTTPICRYHNYHRNGCKKQHSCDTPCMFDHDHCHACRQQGHIALDCTERSNCY